jgi:predicted phosphodiesterase
MKRLLFVPDCHRPYHNEAAWQLMLKAARQFKPHRVVVLGDYLDCYAVSSHDKSPDRKLRFEDEIADGRKGLGELKDSTPIAEHDYVMGNHERWLNRYLASNAPAVYSMLKIDKLLELKERGWRVTPYQRSLKIGKLWITHDEGNAGPQAHERARATFEGNVVIGHTHRMALSYRGNARGRSHVGAMFGWLGDVEHIDYAHRVRAQQWQHGFGVGYMQNNGTVHLQAIPIIEGSCVVAGKLIR